MKRTFGWGVCLLTVMAMSSTTLGNSSQALAQVFTEPKPKSKPKPSKNAPKPKRQRADSDTTSAVTRRSSNFSDPVSYCASNPDVEIIGAPYVGQPMPSWISAAIKPVQSGARTSDSSTSNWRCMSGRVYACSSNNGAAGCAKPVDERVPNVAMIAYCKKKKRGVIPMELAGNVISTWECISKVPNIAGTRTDIDKAGYVLGQWGDVTDFAPAYTIGAVPKRYVGSWVANLRSKGILSSDFRVEIDLVGGQFGGSIGNAKYIQTNAGFESGPKLVCSSQITLSHYGDGKLVGQETITERLAMIDACPVKGPIFIQLNGDQLWIEWRRQKDNKVTLSGAAYRN